jgi:hypothetical protein
MSPQAGQISMSIRADTAGEDSHGSGSFYTAWMAFRCGGKSPGSNLGPAGLFEEERGEYLSRPGYFHREMDFISGLDFDAVHR